MPKCEKCGHFYPEEVPWEYLKEFDLLSPGLPEGAKERPPLLSYCAITQCPRCNPAGEITKLTKAIEHSESIVLSCHEGNPECAEEHDQLARWLIKLRDLEIEILSEHLGE